MSHGLLGVLVAALLVASGCAGSPLATQSDVVTVNGQGSVSITPDTALAQVGVEARAPQLNDALADATQRMTQVLESVRALGIDSKDVSTSRVAIEPIAAPRRNEGDPVRIDGYRVGNTAQVRIRDVRMVGRVLDAVVRAGANTIGSLAFTVSDRTAVEAQARALAVRDAATKAQQLAEAAGVRLGPLLTLTEQGIGRPMPVARGVAAMASMPVEPGEVEVSVLVEARYRLAR
jgi:uncharacterized protein YggE